MTADASRRSGGIIALRGFLTILKALVLRPLLRERGRSLLTIAGIAVGVAVLVAIQLANSSALRAFGESVDAIAGRANFQIVADAAPLDEELLAGLQPLWRLGVRFAPVIDVDGLLERSGIPIRILAVDLLSDLHFRDYRYASVLTTRTADGGAGGTTGQKRTTGGAAEIAAYLDLFRDDSIVLPETFAGQQRLGLGDSLRLNVLGQRRTFVIRGLLQPIGPATAFDGSLAVLDIATAQSSFGMEGKISRIDLMVPAAVEEEAKALLAEVMPPGARLERPSRRNERVGRMLRAFRANLIALAAVALVVGVFLVYNTVLISILRRRDQVGVAKTLGATPRQIFAAFLIEGAVFGATGSAAGVALGYGLAWSTLDIIGRTVNALYVTTAPREIELGMGLVAVAMAAGIVVSLLASIQPALEAAAVSPNTMIRSGMHQRIGRERRRRFTVVALLLFALAWVASLFPPALGLPIGGYVSVLLVIAGFSLLAPFVIVTLSAVMASPLRSAAGVTGKLAAVSLPASLRRVAVAAAALSIAIGMMVAVSLMIGSFRETVRIWVDQTVKSDLWIRPSHGLSNAPIAVFPDEISEDLRRMDMIAAFDRFRGRDLVFRDSLITVGSGDFDVAMSHGELPMVAPRSARRALEDAVRLEGVVVSESFAIKYRVASGDAIELPVAGGTRRFPVTGIYRDYSNDRGVVAMDRSLFETSYGDSSINTIAVFLRQGVDPESARREIERVLGPKYGAFAFTNVAIRAEVMRIFDQTFLITRALLAIALIVAVLGIVNTLAALILERRREIAILEVLGMSSGQVRLMLVLESAILGAASSIIGLASGLVLSLILIHVINKQSFGWTIAFDPPVALIAMSLLATFVATILSGLIPARLASRLRLALALKSE
ncbi:MAG TPA: FtsX-like permease family protein [Thermoanaerobaculia bacterium]|nr:FtsX-like permease family protein [Thermoanaerobaculia bacterium]